MSSRRNSKRRRATVAGEPNGEEAQWRTLNSPRRRLVGGRRPTGTGIRRNRRSRRRRRVAGALIAALIVGGLALVAVVGIVVAVGAGAKHSSDQQKQAVGDVHVTGCSPDEIRVVHAVGDIVNGTSKASTYTVSISVDSPDGSRVGSGDVFESDVAPGQTVHFDVPTTAQGAAPVTCKVTSVSRHASQP